MRPRAENKNQGVVLVRCVTCAYFNARVCGKVHPDHIPPPRAERMTLRYCRFFEPQKIKTRQAA